MFAASPFFIFQAISLCAIYGGFIASHAGFVVPKIALHIHRQT
jgi:hypothetical protein